MHTQSSQLPQEAVQGVSSYGAVLDYSVAFASPHDHAASETTFTTKRTVKCLTGFSMSIVWDLEFQSGLAHAYGGGMYGMDQNRNHDVAAVCPVAGDQDAEASLSVLINCGVDVKRDAWGHPKEEEDHEAVETCTRMAWAWLKERVDVERVEPWKGLCREFAGEVRCDRDVFHMRHGGSG